ncbi:MAG: hypothetical protein HQL96_04455 [Magnetococcales bacterium]|nr:hypothetical protein [Magnetococcales bacterium]
MTNDDPQNIPDDDEPRPELDWLWSQEAEARLVAYRRGELSAFSLFNILAAYGRP